jgi:hypothetical protein
MTVSVFELFFVIRGQVWHKLVQMPKGEEGIRNEIN